MGWYRFYDCTIEKVEISDKYPEGVTLSILNNELQEKMNEPYRVSFWPTSKNQIREMIEGKRERCCFSNGMQDIDIYKHGDNYVVLHSPYETENRVFILKDGQIEKVLKEIG